ncbi:MAG: hypothetical protein M3Y33_14050 [Actinomycetota bacterium]|nr:hypothetical protein [Actinomycetota bacterium]
MNAKIRLVLAGAASLPLLAGCSAYSAAHNYNLPTPARIERGTATRIETPGNFPSVVRVCETDGTGVYVAMDASSSPWVLARDPGCKQPAK